NPVYGGIMVQGRQRVVSYKVHQTMSVSPEDWYVVEGTHTPIVSPDLLERARAIRESRTRRTPGGGEVHLLAGFLRCADCGASMTRKTARGIAYYTCSTYRRKSKLACTSHTVREDKVTAVLADCLGCSPTDLTRPLLFQRLEKAVIREGGEVIPCPVPEDDSVII
ncbi:MAG: recombinase zinc beta ribbon domain-containing protein, partial [Ruminiclostridium sp.]|nr:recombinase zinc beta ribbon domain-containing protein [Ruminiclostridium sp.]